jgi:hypothetical protein
MTIRTTERAVTAIVQVSSVIASVMPFIEVANNLVNNVCVPEGYDAVTLEKIERYLAAHFYRLRVRQAIEQKIGEATDIYSTGANISGKGLNGTEYGQAAMDLDYKGALATMQAANDKGRRGTKVGVAHVGASCRRLPSPAGFNPFL